MTAKEAVKHLRAWARAHMERQDGEVLTKSHRVRDKSCQ